MRIGGDRFDEAIINYVRRNHGTLIGESTAERIKMEIGCAFTQTEVSEIEISGRNLAEGVPRMFTINSNEILEALHEPLAGIVSAVRSALEQTPPELCSDVAERGIVLTGGGALLRDIDRLISTGDRPARARRRRSADLRRPRRRPRARSWSTSTAGISLRQRVKSRGEGTRGEGRAWCAVRIGRIGSDSAPGRHDTDGSRISSLQSPFDRSSTCVRAAGAPPAARGDFFRSCTPGTPGGCCSSLAPRPSPLAPELAPCPSPAMTPRRCSPTSALGTLKLVVYLAAAVMLMVADHRGDYTA